MNGTTIQGDFADKDVAERAKSALKQAGIADTRIRMWNILGVSASEHGRGSAITAGAVVGGVVAGAPGLVAGAAIGAVLDAGNDEEHHLPEPNGVCVVVDIRGDADRIKANLLSSGATNVHIGSTAR